MSLNYQQLIEEKYQLNNHVNKIDQRRNLQEAQSYQEPTHSMSGPGLIQQSSLSVLPNSIQNLDEKDQRLFVEFGIGKKQSIPYEFIHHAFEKQVSLHPHGVAATHLSESISYTELNQKAELLAQYLRERGVSSGDCVAVFVQRSIPMLIGFLAVLKCGAAYVPQDVGVTPLGQLQHMLEITGVKIVLSLKKFESVVSSLECESCVYLDEFNWDAQYVTKSLTVESFSDVREDEHRKKSSPVCFVLFTSGTTGKPNGVRVTHKNLCNIILTEPGSLGIEPGIRVSQILNISFDMSAWEIWGCLSHGGTLIIRNKSIEQAAKNADVIIATPSILAKINHQHCHRTKVVAVAGEPCPKPLALKWAEQCTFYNSCGPTETTIINTLTEVRSGADRISIGEPTPNNNVYILNEEQKPCAIGEVGEMWAGGAGITSGYVNNPMLTFERYKPDPFLGGEHVMFRTRDLGRWTAEGKLEHFGRTDDQVKVKGFRVELDSIAAALETLDGCDKAVIIKFDAQNLIAFVGSTVDVVMAKQQVANSLPYYCVPAHIICLEKFPITSRGKVDKKRLYQIAQDHMNKAMEQHLRQEETA